MARHGEYAITIDRPIDAVFDFLAEGENDKLFSSRIIEIHRIEGSNDAAGAVYRSTARDFGRTAVVDIEITAFERPTRIQWTQRSKAPIAIESGGYLLQPDGAGTRLTFWGDLAGHGVGKLILGFVSSRVRAGFPAYLDAMKRVIEEPVPA